MHKFMSNALDLSRPIATPPWVVRCKRRLVTVSYARYRLEEAELEVLHVIGIFGKLGGRKVSFTLTGFYRGASILVTGDYLSASLDLPGDKDIHIDLNVTWP